MNQAALHKRIMREAQKAAKQNQKIWKEIYANTKRKPITVCQKCGAEGDTFQYVDESNFAISKNSPHLCRKCYVEKYSR